VAVIVLNTPFSQTAPEHKCITRVQ